MKHTRYPTRGEPVLRWWARRRRATRETLSTVAQDALARGWHFYLPTPAGGREPVKGLSRVLAVHMAAPLALFMERELD